VGCGQEGRENQGSAKELPFYLQEVSSTPGSEKEMPVRGRVGKIAGKNKLRNPHYSNQGGEPYV